MSYDREAVQASQIRLLEKKVASGAKLEPAASAECRSCARTFASQLPVEMLTFLGAHSQHVTFVYPKGKANSPQTLV